jgi:transposase
VAIFEVPDELWEPIQAILSATPRRHRWPGRRRLDDRACLNGILFVLLTGITWHDLPSSSATAPG